MKVSTQLESIWRKSQSIFDPTTKAFISALGMEQSVGTSKQRAMRNAELQDPFFLLNPTPDHTARSSLEASLKSHLHLAVRGINRPLISKTPICLLVICLLVSHLVTKSSMSLSVVVSPEKVFITWCKPTSHYAPEL